LSDRKIVYQNWIVEIGRDPKNPPDVATSPGEGFIPELVSLDQFKHLGVADPAVVGSGVEAERVQLIRERVAVALAMLPDNEREFIERFYFIGQGYREISEKSGRSIHKLEAIHKRAVRRLKKELWPIVEELFGLARPGRPDCPICISPSRGDIDRIIETKKPEDTWRPIIAAIKQRYGLKVLSPLLLIGHQKYH